MSEQRRPALRESAGGPPRPTSWAAACFLVLNDVFCAIGHHRSPFGCCSAITTCCAGYLGHLFSYLAFCASLNELTCQSMWQKSTITTVSWLLSLLGGQRAAVQKDAIKGRGDPSRTSPNQEAKSSTGLAHERNRRSRSHDLRAKPAGIWAQASKRKLGDREVASAIYAWCLLASGLKAI